MSRARIRDDCAWCHRPLPADARRDSKFCSTSHRQASHRFGKGRGLKPSLGDRPMRFAYADPPYPGLARRYYRDHPDYGGEVDHAALLSRLVREFPDGWALSTSAAALPQVLALSPPVVDVAVWVCGERPTKSYRPLNAWQPVIYFGGRMLEGSVDARRIDVLQHASRPRLTDPNRVIGAKPAAFCYWMFSLLGALPGDELVDLFPGSGGVSRAWDAYSSRPDRLPLFEERGDEVLSWDEVHLVADAKLEELARIRRLGPPTGIKLLGTTAES